MLKKFKSTIIISLLFFMLFINAVFSEDAVNIKFSEISINSGETLAYALKQRKSTRDFTAQAIGDSMLGNLLWSAAGTNRPTEKKRTFPSTNNMQDIDLYVLRSDGSWFYDPMAHTLRKINNSGIPTKGSILLVYVLDKSRTNPTLYRYSYFHAGSMTQNAALYCASVGLGNVVRSTFDRETINKLLRISDDSKEIVIVQNIGWAK